MAVSQKIKPKTVDLSASLSMLNSTEPTTSEPVSTVIPTVEPQIQTGAPVVKAETPVVNEIKTETQTPVMSTVKDTQVIFRTTEANKNSLKGFFASYGFTLSKGIQMACFYLEQEIKAGNITMGPAGIIKKEK